MWTKGLWSVCVSLALFGFLGVLRAAEVTKEGEQPKDRPAKADVVKAEPPAEPKLSETKAAIPKGDIVAKVDDIVIGRLDLEAARRFFAMTNPQVPLTGKQALEQVINRILWSRYCEKKNLRPTADELKAAVGQLDQELRKRGTDYQKWIASQGMRVEDHLGLLSYDLAMRKLVADIQKKTPDDEIKAEYDAHPDWYDGSKVRLSQIFIDTSSLDKADQEKAKARVDQVYAKLAAGGNFENLASDYGEGQGAGMGGDRGWFARKGADVDEPLMSAVWSLKVGEYTKPILGARGWQILKVTGHEPAIYTPFGCRPGILNELARKKLEALLEELKGPPTKIEIFM
jgi:peptidyl-prolyl cis-trans isomerase SurA